MRILGVNAVFHDPAAALVVDGVIAAAAEEERFSRRKHGKAPVPFSTWELPEQAIAFCLEEAGLRPDEIDRVAYSYDPSLAKQPSGSLIDEQWEGLRTLYARRAPHFLRTAMPGLEPGKVRFVPHHVAHAASAYLAAPQRESCVLVVDGRGEQGSHLSGVARGGELEVLARTELPHSLGLLYENLTAHLGFKRASDEYKVMALASYGVPRFLPALRDAVRAQEDGTFLTEPVDFASFASPGRGEAETAWAAEHADLAASVQACVEETLLALARWLHRKTGVEALTMAGGVALNCVANARLAAEGSFSSVWVQPAAGDAGTALGAALYCAHESGDDVQPMRTAALGRRVEDDAVAEKLRRARVPFFRPGDMAAAIAEVLEADGVVALAQGRSEFGPRALGHRSLLADPRRKANLERMNDIKGREQFRPIAPMVSLERAGEIFEGQLPSPFMLFTHRVREAWRDRIPAVVHVDGTARIQTVDHAQEPLVHEILCAFEERTGVPVVVNTSFNTAGRPMVDDVADALECFASAPIDALAVGPYLVRRGAMFS